MLGLIAATKVRTLNELVGFLSALQRLTVRSQMASVSIQFNPINLPHSVLYLPIGIIFWVKNSCFFLLMLASGI